MLITPSRRIAVTRLNSVCCVCRCRSKHFTHAAPLLQPTQARRRNNFYGWHRTRLGWTSPCISTSELPRGRTITRAANMLLPIGMDVLTFLTTTVIMIPIFKYFKISPILGFLLCGFILQQLGMFQDLEDTEKLAELGVLFLLFEMGLELSIDRLKALAKYAFGMGTMQMVVSTLFFTLFALPVGHGVGTIFLEKLVHAPAGLVGIRTIDEAVVIGAALSLSSSAFVLQLLSDRGELATRFGSATLGILLLQDIAVVPFLVLLPLIENGDGAMGTSPFSLIQQLAPTALKTSAGLGLLLLGGRFVLRRIFEMVAASKSSETFVALCLLTVTGASLFTQKLGLSDTLGAFMAGVLLSETSYRTQVEADIRPFRGLLLGLFFLTTGSSLDWDILEAYWPIVFWMLTGLIAIKTLIVASIGGFFGLSRPESIRTAFYLSQSGEFAFVLLSLAKDLNVLPENLNHLLIIVVVMSMALTPALAETGKWVAEDFDRRFGSTDVKDYSGLEGNIQPMKEDEPVVICGFGPQAQMLANMLEVPLAADRMQLKYVAFDLDPVRVQASRKAGFTVVFGDGSRSAVLKAAGVKTPKAVVVCYAIREQSVRATKSIRCAYPDIPIYAWARDLRHAAELEESGADTVMIASTQAGLALGSQLLAGLGATEEEVTFLKSAIQEAMAARTHALAQTLQEPSTVMNDGGTQLEIFVLDTTRHGPSGAAAAAAQMENASAPAPIDLPGLIIESSVISSTSMSDEVPGVVEERVAVAEKQPGGGSRS